MFLYFQYIYFFPHSLKQNTINLFSYTNSLSLSWNCKNNFRKSGEKKIERRNILGFKPLPENKMQNKVKNYVG